MKDEDKTEKETDLKQTEKVLLDSYERLKQTMVAARMGIWEWDIVSDHMIWSENVNVISGPVKAIFEGTYENFLNLVHPEDRPVIMQSVNAALEKVELGNCYEVEFRIIMPDGKIWWNYGRGQVIRDETGRPLRIVGVGMDITDRKQREETLRSLSLIDELTGLYNRRQFFNLAEQQFKVAIRTKKKLLLLFIDLDSLKWINDHHGHTWGDLALIDIVNVLKETFRQSDIIARIGGDEFVVLAVENADMNYETLNTRLQKNMDAHNAKGSRRYKLSISVGITQFDPEHPFSIDELLTRADALMYEEKRKKEHDTRKALMMDDHGEKSQNESISKPFP